MSQHDDVAPAADPLAPPPASGPPLPPDAGPPPPKQRFPTWKQGFVLLGGSLVLAVSACFGCLFTLDLGGRRGWASSGLEAVAILLGILAFAGLLGMLVGGVLLFMRILRALFGSAEPRPPSPPPPPMPPPPQDRMPS